MQPLWPVAGYKLVLFCLSRLWGNPLQSCGCSKIVMLMRECVCLAPVAQLVSVRKPRCREIVLWRPSHIRTFTSSACMFILHYSSLRRQVYFYNTEGFYSRHHLRLFSTVLVCALTSKLETTTARHWKRWMMARCRTKRTQTQLVLFVGILVDFTEASVYSSYRKHDLQIYFCELLSYQPALFYKLQNNVGLIRKSKTAQ